MSSEMTKYKSLSHWFSYNWGWVLGAAFLILFAVYTRFFQPSDPEADYVISWVGQTYLSDSEVGAVSDAIGQAGADQNGDGRVTVSVSQYIIDFDMDSGQYGSEDNYAYAMKLMAEIQANHCYLFLLENPEQFQRFTGVLPYLDGTIPSEEDGYECANWEQMCVLWQPDGLEHTAYLGRRSFFGGEDSQQLFPGSDALFDTLAGGH